MKHKYLVLQPPITDEYRLLVDDKSRDSIYGIAQYFDKVIYNLDLLGKDLALDIEIRSPLTRKGSAHVLF